MARRTVVSQWTEGRSAAAAASAGHITLIGTRHIFTHTGADDARLVEQTSGRLLVVEGATVGRQIRSIGGGRITIT